MVIEGHISPSGNLSGAISPRAVLSGKMKASQTLRGRLSPSGVLCGAIAAQFVLSGTLTIATGTAPAYHGPTEFVPGNAVQIVECAGLVMSSNVVVDAIPSNYGLIGWNGVTLSVS
jgi:hypothetical protein